MLFYLFLISTAWAVLMTTWSCVHNDPFLSATKNKKRTERTEVVSIVVSGRHVRVLCFADDTCAEMICDLSRIVHD